MNRRGVGRAAGWHDALLALGIIFLLLSVIVFALEALTPTGITNSGSFSPYLLPLGGILGIVLIVLGLWERGGTVFGGRR